MTATHAIGLPGPAPTAAELQADIERHLVYTLGKDTKHASLRDWRMALSFAIRDRIVDPWFAATRRAYAHKAKRVYYLSMEFLIGRLLEDAIHNLGLGEVTEQAMAGHGQDLMAVMGDEPDAALGNGGLGRLAACFLESLSTIGVPAHGYGIRYENGLFKQSFDSGRQVEEPEDWLRQQHAWEFERPEVSYGIGFGGSVAGGPDPVWNAAEHVIASAHDTPIIGWKGRWANTLRLWEAKPLHDFDLARFNKGEYAAAAEPEALARTISRVLYPDDTTDQGRELRLKQEYFFTAASLADILRRFQSEYDDLHLLPKKVAIQLNDTHPAIAGPELVRLLADERGMAFDDAVETARATLSYTNHTLLPEALEKWSDGLMGKLLPRHLEIIERIDAAHAKAHPSRQIAITGGGCVHMGELSFVMAHRVNGVSALHTELMKETVFADLHRLHPERIVNQTNGVTPRRWLMSCNPRLSALVTERIGDGWVDDLEQLQRLENDGHLEDASFMEAYGAAKTANKADLAQWFADSQGLQIDPQAMFDIQIKRIHEYKRQHLNLLEAIALWQEMRDDPKAGWTPRVKIFAGKAAPGYVFAKEIIHLINDVAAVVNADPLTRDFLKIAYPPNYNVTLAERLIPAADLSEQISTAGKEASGTGNMKFALNGALTIGTLDGANVEIREKVGADNFFLFGMTAPEVLERRKIQGHARAAIEADPRLARALKAIEDGTFGDGDPARHASVAGNLRDHDYFLVCSDFASYWEKSREVDAAFADTASWRHKAALNTVRSGWFSSDRTIRGYMTDIWGAEPIPDAPDPLRTAAE